MLFNGIHSCYLLVEGDVVVEYPHGFWMFLAVSLLRCPLRGLFVSHFES